VAFVACAVFPTPSGVAFAACAVFPTQPGVPLAACAVFPTQPGVAFAVCTVFLLPFLTWSGLALAFLTCAVILPHFLAGQERHSLPAQSCSSIFRLVSFLISN